VFQESLVELSSMIDRMISGGFALKLQEQVKSVSDSIEGMINTFKNAANANYFDS
jgi:hypothetical protein